MIEHILLIDDNSDDLEFFSGLLHAAGKHRRVHTADCLDVALELYNANDMHCILIDYNMPEMNGLEIFEKLSTLSAKNTLAAVILTGEPHQKVQAEAARLGALDYIVKSTTNTAEQLEVVISKTVDWAESLNQKPF